MFDIDTSPVIPELMSERIRRYAHNHELTGPLQCRGCGKQYYPERGEGYMYEELVGPVTCSKRCYDFITED